MTITSVEEKKTCAKGTISLIPVNTNIGTACTDKHKYRQTQARASAPVSRGAKVTSIHAHAQKQGRLRVPIHSAAAVCVTWEDRRSEEGEWGRGPIAIPVWPSSERVAGKRPSCTNGGTRSELVSFSVCQQTVDSAAAMILPLSKPRAMWYLSQASRYDVNAVVAPQPLKRDSCPSAGHWSSRQP